MSASKTAVVVGATGALGQVLVARLAAQGLQVLAVARSATALATLQQAHPGIQVCVADIAQDSVIEAVQQQLTSPVAIAVLSVGLPTAGGVSDVPPDYLGQAANIKAGGMARLTRAVLPNMVRGSRLVAIGGHYGYEPTAYTAGAGVANAALANLMRQLNWTHGRQGITSHLIAPGPMDTERLRKVAQGRAVSEGRDIEAVLDAMRAESAIGALTTLDQVAWAVTMLLAPEADALAGSTLFLDSGMRRGLP
jgi:short-subunit dehydrogenase